ncbi:segregation and condensation protein A [Sporolituus thermophilus]|uniref:segregation and condensation protein A n=1 Tax=Sporolituus thermophilus TaxID=608505 RepID=UPI003CCBBFDB
MLLHLIEKDQIDIYDIPIAQVTEQYIAYLKAWEEFNLDIASEFLVMAATLLQIKSRMLLPRPPAAVETAEEEDPRQELVEKLVEYRKFKQLATLLQSLAEKRLQYFTRPPQEFYVAPPLPQGLKLDDLIMAFAAVLESAVDNYALVARDEISVQDKMYDIIHLLHKTGRIEFWQTITRTGSRSEVVAALLAVLELLRLKRVTVYQDRCFGPIFIALRE